MLYCIGFSKIAFFSKIKFVSRYFYLNLLGLYYIGFKKRHPLENRGCMSSLGGVRILTQHAIPDFLFFNA